MQCEFDHLIYPRDSGTVSMDSYMVAVYRPCEKMLDSAGNEIVRITAVGYGLPMSAGQRYELSGHWRKNAKYGVQYEVESFREVIPPTKEGIIAYLSSGQIKGIGPKLAGRIFDAFGLDTLEILDKEPARLLSIPRISERVLEKAMKSYMENRCARDVVAFLVPHGITAARAVRFYQEYGEKALDIVQNHPYQLCELVGIGFKTADEIALKMGIDRLSTDRADAALLYTLAEAETRGSLCMEKHSFLKACLKIMETPEISEEMLANRAMRLLGDGSLVSYHGYVYRAKAAKAEENLASMVANQMRCRSEHAYRTIEAEIDAEEQTLQLRFAPEQRQAIKMALTEGVSIITGGPGTGKTLIQRAILDIYRAGNPECKICCCAPTGRASRRMEQSTGYPASTIHKALGLHGDDEEDSGSNQLEADLILVDEISMLDAYLAEKLFEALPRKAQIVLIGDADQLPSVGPGAVLSEMIASGEIPVSKLDRVFRQSADSHIAVNAKLIRHGNLSLEYGDDFQFFSSATLAESAELICKLYMQEVQRYGVDNVALLTPFRQKTETGANALNRELRDVVNPPGTGKSEVEFRGRVLRCGDKVMQVRNREEVSNGDIGFVKGIAKVNDEVLLQVDFGEGRTVDFDFDALEQLDLGYASTIHKSQGSEYKSVIINLQNAHYTMLNRPLVYTAITRGQECVIIVGERRALCMAIKKTDTEKRGTCLAQRIRQELAQSERSQYGNRVRSVS